MVLEEATVPQMVVEEGGGRMLRFFELWMRIRIFVQIWLAGLLFLVAASVIRYHAFLGEVLSDNTIALVNAVMPVIIMAGAIVYLLRSIFR